MTTIVMDRTESLGKLAELINEINFAMFTTVDSEGHLRSRPMGTLEVDKAQGVLWFFSKDNLSKNEEIQQNSQVNIAYCDIKDQRYVSVSGRAQTVHDKNKIAQLWKPIFRAWYPEGKEDKHICLIRVEIEKAEYWDSPSGKMVEIAGFIKAVLTGKELKYAGKNEKLSFS